MAWNGLNRVLDRLGDQRLLAPGPVDLVLDDATLERVAGDAEQVCSFDNATRFGEGLFTEEAFGVGEVEAFEGEAHAGSLGIDTGADKDEIVCGLYKRSST